MTQLRAHSLKPFNGAVIALVYLCIVLRPVVTGACAILHLSLYSPNHERTSNVGLSQPKPLSSDELVKKIALEQLPLFEFRTELDAILLSTSGSSYLLAQNLFQTYLDALRDNYSAQFLQLCSTAQMQHSSSTRIRSLRDYLLKECEAAMNAAIPIEYKEGHWDYKVSLCI